MTGVASLYMCTSVNNTLTGKGKDEWFLTIENELKMLKLNWMRPTDTILAWQQSTTIILNCGLHTPPSSMETHSWYELHPPSPHNCSQPPLNNLFTTFLLLYLYGWHRPESILLLLQHTTCLHCMRPHTLLWRTRWVTDCSVLLRG